MKRLQNRPCTCLAPETIRQRLRWGCSLSIFKQRYREGIWASDSGMYGSKNACPSCVSKDLNTPRCLCWMTLTYEKTRWHPRIRMQTHSKNYICPNDTLVGHSCGTLFWDTLVGQSCRTLLWVSLTGRSCRTLLWDTLIGHSCGALFWDTLVGPLLWLSLIHI